MGAHYVGAGRSVPSSIVWSATLRRWIESRLDPHPPRRTIWSAVGWGPTLSESSFWGGTNLLQNSWKYTRPSDHARIELSVDRDESEIPTYCVRDNGIGFDNDERERIFGVFERLHTAEEYTGSGLGLATVERIVRRHGGRVWAEGTPGEGAVFRFTVTPPSTDGDPI